VDGRVVTLGVLIVAGVRDDGRREVLAVAAADTESEATYHELCTRRKDRGRRGVELVTSDDPRGLTAAMARHLAQGAPRGELAALPGPLCAQSAGDGGRQAPGAAGRGAPGHVRGDRRGAGATTWKASHPQVAAKLDEEIEDCLACDAFPAAHRSRSRTTNGLERLNQELKRRTRVVRIFPNRAARERLVTALALEQSEEWVSGRRSLDMDPFWEERRRPVVPAPIADAAD